MSEHTVTVDWKRETPDFAYQSYNRDHNWTFDAGITVRASAAPAYLGSESCVDPEEAFVASLSSCHMLTFLAIACKKRFTVDGYRDQAVGILGKDQTGRLAMTRVTLDGGLLQGQDRLGDGVFLDVERHGGDPLGEVVEAAAGEGPSEGVGQGLPDGPGELSFGHDASPVSGPDGSVTTWQVPTRRRRFQYGTPTQLLWSLSWKLLARGNMRD